MNGAVASLRSDQRGTFGVRATLLAITLVTPVTAPPNRDIMNDTAPRQWQITCRRRSPMCSRTLAIAAGKS